MAVLVSNRMVRGVTPNGSRSRASCRDVIGFPLRHSGQGRSSMPPSNSTRQVDEIRSTSPVSEYLPEVLEQHDARALGRRVLPGEATRGLPGLRSDPAQIGNGQQRPPVVGGAIVQ